MAKQAFVRTKPHLNQNTVEHILLYDVHNPLYNSVMYAWINLFGDSELSIRLPSILAGFGSASATVPPRNPTAAIAKQAPEPTP